MTNKKDDIIYSAEHIRRYWNGQLSPEEMHALEQAALDDPFLADAMEGYEAAMQQYEAPVIDGQLEELRRQLHTRSSKPAATAPVRSFRWWQAAAAIIILAGSATWFYFSNQNHEHNALAHTQQPTTEEQLSTVADSFSQQPATDPALVTTATDSSNAIVEELPVPPIARSRTAAPPASTPAPATTPVRTDSLTELTNRARAEAAIVEARKQQHQDDMARMVKEPEPEVVRIESKYAGRVTDTSARLNDVKLQDFIKGVVTDHHNNPLANAFVQVENYRSNYFTDMQGFFKIPVSTDSPIHVVVGSPGFVSRRIRLQNAVTSEAPGFNRISLEPNDSLADVAVMAYSNSDKKAKRASNGYPMVMVQNAQPLQGWIAYENYLSRNKKIPPGQKDTTGQVAVSFEVNKKGELSDFRIEQSLSKQHDAEAVRLIREGPKWKLLKGRKARATVIVRF